MSVTVIWVAYIHLQKGLQNTALCLVDQRCNTTVSKKALMGYKIKGANKLKQNCLKRQDAIFLTSDIHFDAMCKVNVVTSASYSIMQTYCQICVSFLYLRNQTNNICPIIKRTWQRKRYDTVLYSHCNQCLISIAEVQCRNIHLLAKIETLVHCMQL